jgi:hypothetical protein
VRQESGCGFDTAAEKGFGFLSMEEWVARVGDAPGVKSRKSSETALSALAPVAGLEKGS